MTFRAVALAWVLIMSGCGGGNPADPSGNSGSGSSGTATITAVIDGAAFNGTTSTTIASNTNGIFSTAATSGNTTLGFGALAAVGTTSIGGLSPTNALLQISSAGSSSGWVANPTGGSGTLTISTLTATGATGTFSFTMTPAPGTAASGNKTVTNGTFNVRF